MIRLYNTRVHIQGPHFEKEKRAWRKANLIDDVISAVDRELL